MMTNCNLATVESFCPSLQNEDRRARPRTEIHATIQYQAQGATYFNEGVLHDISETGALISCQEVLDIGAYIHIIMASEDPAESSIHITGVAVRKISEPGIDEICYGCRLVRVADPN